MSAEGCAEAERPKRHNYLSVTELPLLRAWGAEVNLMFDTMPYQVGSSLVRKDWRDVDVRVMLDAAEFDALVASRVDIYYLNLAVSLWGQKVTGLPIDFQVQAVEPANLEFGGGQRNPCGIAPRAFQQTRWDNGTFPRRAETTAEEG